MFQATITYALMLIAMLVLPHLCHTSTNIVLVLIFCVGLSKSHTSSQLLQAWALGRSCLGDGLEETLIIESLERRFKRLVLEP